MRAVRLINRAFLLVASSDAQGMNQGHSSDEKETAFAWSSYSRIHCFASATCVGPSWDAGIREAPGLHGMDWTPDGKRRFEPTGLSRAVPGEH